MSANPDPRPIARESYYYRRQLSGPEVLRALAIGVGVGLAAFHIARLLSQRTPLDDVDSTSRRRRLPRSAGEAG